MLGLNWNNFVKKEAKMQFCDKFFKVAEERKKKKGTDQKIESNKKQIWSLLKKKLTINFSCGGVNHWNWAVFFCKAI